MKIYLAGPMRGIPMFNFPAFDEVAKTLQALGHEVFNPAEEDRKSGFNPETDQPKPLREYMVKDLAAVCSSDAVVALDGWEKSQGARLEVRVAADLGIYTYTLLGEKLEPLEFIASRMAVEELEFMLRRWAQAAHSMSREKGWWEKDRNDAEMIALMHSELSEALEALRHGNPPDNHIPDVSGVEAEFADVMIRMLDFCGARRLNLGRAVAKKFAYNATRPHKHGGKAF